LNILDVPANNIDETGNQPFIQQVADTLKEDPLIWNSPQMQDLYNTLNTSLSNSRPLPVYASNANVYSSYQDSQKATPIPVNANGSFNSQILTEAGNSSTELEASLNEDNYLNVEAITGGDINSSNNDTTHGLKSCPSKIMVIPGQVVIFKVYAYPTANLKDASLTLTLKNPDIGYITPPIYLNIFGQKKYSEASCVFYARKNIGDTPVITTITAITKTGLKVDIPVEIVKSTTSISGHVYTGGSSLIKGYVKACGIKGSCKLDTSGNYILEKVFKAHNVKVTATWWTFENGKKIRHREEKVIDFLSTNVTEFNFGLLPTPTMTPTSIPYSATSVFYDIQVSDVIRQFKIWETELGSKQATQKTVDWLNRGVRRETI